ncbi:MAG: LD-carboxypeptidase [Deltaproteobacteria bacterium CG11_big_fil_rev_8_21_14_0_20_47_16]|nr:MAG: LD-carboxypeptidase [Deltaproteobacteria bacterium CG11_big_fil_rev_8_21_14_0_20_47_16]
MELIKPKALKAGDTIAVIAPSSNFERDRLLDGIAALEHAGFKIIYRDDIFAKDRYLAGPDARRTDELIQYLKDPTISAVMCARGGYGAQRIASELNLKKLKASPKWVIGYSDVTVLLNLIRNQLGWMTVYGPTVAGHFGSKSPRENMEWLLRLTTQSRPLGAVPTREAIVVKPGFASGRVAGGCLTLVQMGIGTPYDVQTDNAVLFLEDRGEKLYEIDRMLQHLKHAGKLNKVKGIVFGSMLLHPQEADKNHELIPLLQDVLSDFEGPVIANFPAGHIDPFMPLPLGVMSTLNTDPLEWNFTEAACS